MGEVKPHLAISIKQQTLYYSVCCFCLSASRPTSYLLITLMPARKLSWLDPFVDRSIDNGKQKLPLLFDYLELLASYFFELVTIIVIARIHHLKTEHNLNAVKRITDRMTATPASLTSESTELNQIQAMTSLCLGILPLDEATILNLRSVDVFDRKNCYRRIDDAISVLGDIQFLLLALAYEDQAYEEFFELDLNLNLNLGSEND